MVLILTLVVDLGFFVTAVWASGSGNLPRLVKCSLATLVLVALTGGGLAFRYGASIALVESYLLALAAPPILLTALGLFAAVSGGWSRPGQILAALAGNTLEVVTGELGAIFVAFHRWT